LKPAGLKHNALRQVFISYRVAQVQDVAKVSGVEKQKVENRNSGRKHYAAARGAVEELEDFLLTFPDRKFRVGVKGCIRELQEHQ